MVYESPFSPLSLKNLGFSYCMELYVICSLIVISCSDMFTLICSWTVTIDMVELHLGNDVNTIKSDFTLPCFVWPHSVRLLKVSGEINLHCHRTFTTEQYCIFKMVGHDGIAMTSCLLNRKWAMWCYRKGSFMSVLINVYSVVNEYVRALSPKT